jgi:ERCC4-type nuclease
LNQNSIADYFWSATDNHTIQIERKQTSELLSEFDVIEEQLNRYLDNADEIGLILEGILRPHYFGCEALKVKGNKLISQVVSKRPYAEIIAWLWQLDKAGITVYRSIDYMDTAQQLVSFYNNSQKPEHTTLRRYIKHKLPAWQPDPDIAFLTNIVGEVTATKLVEGVGDRWKVMNAGVEELISVPGIGKATAEKLLKAIGRIT